MSFRVTIEGTEIAFPCEADESVLDAAQKAGYELPYSCRKGVCATCEGKIVAGEALVSGEGPTHVVSGERDGVPFCKTWPRSDLAITPKRFERLNPEARKTVPAKVYRLARPSHDVVVLNLRFPAGVKVKFRAGQYLQVIMDDGERRSFSMANPTSEKDGAQLHIRQVPGGRFSDAIVSGLKVGDSLRVELPFGDFFLREDGEKPILLIATGTGFAPIKSIVEDALKRGVRRPMTLYWGARTQADLYMAELPMRWAAQHPFFTFVPVLSEGGADWRGRRGLVHEAALADYPDLSGHQVYACGNPLMTDACRRQFVALRGLPENEIYCDAFVIGA